jgi:hypothetical protein
MHEPQPQQDDRYGQDDRAHGLARDPHERGGAGRGLGCGKVRRHRSVPDPHLSQFPNESVPIRTVSLAGFGNRVPSERPHVCTLAIFCRLDSPRGTAKSATPKREPRPSVPDVR